MRFFFRRKSASVKFQYAIVFLQKASNNYARSQVMEMQGLHLAFGIRFQYAIVFLQKAKNTCASTGDAGHCSPKLAHAMRSLYHLSYIHIV